MIIAGKYEGNYFVLNDQKIAFISKDPVKLNVNTFVSTMYKDDIKSITKESEHASGNKEHVAYWLGSIAAAGVSETKIFVIKIVWQDGSESLANITDSQYQYVLATQMKFAPTFQKDTSLMAPSIEGKRFTFAKQPYIGDSKRTIEILLTNSDMRIDCSCDKSLAFNTVVQKAANKTEAIPYSKIKGVQLIYNKHLTITFQNGESIPIHSDNEAKVVECAKLIEEKVKLHNPQFKKTSTEEEIASKFRAGLLVFSIIGILFSTLLFFISGISIFIPILMEICSIILFVESIALITKNKQKEKSKAANVTAEEVFSFKKESEHNVSVRSKSTSLEGTITIPSTYSKLTVTTISADGFSCCEKIETIVIPISVKVIEKKAFADCSSLKEIIYNGPMCDWEKIYKSLSWDDNTPQYVIRCTDGTISK